MHDLPPVVYENVTARESFKNILLGTFYLVPSRFYH